MWEILCWFDILCVIPNTVKFVQLELWGQEEKAQGMDLLLHLHSCGLFGDRNRRAFEVIDMSFV